jgi:RNA polymerase sigma-70 factor (ECF subfamily)
VEPKDQHNSGEDRYFVTTRWSIIVASRSNRSEIEKARDALAQLCRIYWRPVHDFIRRKGYGPQDAEDLAQDFFMKIVTSDFLLHADQERGKFRALLLTSLQNFLLDARDGARALKRGGGQQLSRTDNDIPAEAEPGWSPERLFDVSWAGTLSERALDQLKEECVRAGRERVFVELSPFLSLNVDDWNYEKATEVLGMPGATVRTLVKRLRERYRSLLRAEVAETVDTPGEVEEELRYLYDLLIAGSSR